VQKLSAIAGGEGGRRRPDGSGAFGKRSGSVGGAGRPPGPHCGHETEAPQARAGLAVARQAAVLQAALWGVVVGLVAWHWWDRWRPLR
jgi:hypothetical protein